MAHALRRPYRTSGAGRSRTRTAAARGASAMGSLLLAVARLVRLVAWLVAIVIVVAIVLRIAGANPANVIVRDIHDVGKVLVGPFHNVFTIKNPKASIAANWGLAAVVWLIVGSVIASLLARIAPRPV
jgi:energy-converting hydrogenase Eha subunit B